MSFSTSSSLRVGLAFAIATAALVGCGSSSGGGTGAAGTGAGTGTGGGTGTVGTGTGGSYSTLKTADLGSCATGSAAVPLSHEELTPTGSFGLSWIDDALGLADCGGNCRTGSLVISDQTQYQPFQDHGFPAVDFATKAVLVSAAEKPDSCGGVPSSGLTVTTVDGVPRLEISYSFVDMGTAGPSSTCYTCFLFGYSLTAVTIDKPATTPTFCTHVTTGCP